ncbi:MAG: Hsp70 family protein, partial [Rhodothermales bacterium]
HIREAWNERMARDDADVRFERQHVVLTVPASFDEVARELTVEAAHRAGITRLVLLEEPLAAFYAWLDGHAAERDVMQDGQIVLVCDVGGGTSDFSVIGIRREDENVRFERLAVGDHLMLGGDNMDHALGRQVEIEAAGGVGKLDVQRWHQLVQQCREAKEALLGEDAPDRAHVGVAARGSDLIGSTIRATLYRDDAERIVLQGFFPETDLDAELQGNRRAGLAELGLPYETDPAISRHLAAFWRRVLPLLQQETGRDAPRPDYLLFNGGVFSPALLRERLRGIVGRWFDASGDWQPEALSGNRLDFAVAHGAAYYGLVRLGEGVRVGSGSARAYYVGVIAGEGESAEGVQPAVCLIPRGAEEGFSGQLTERPVEALTNQPVTFHLFSSMTRTSDRFGQVVHLDADEAQALPPIRTVLKFGKKGIARALPVELGVMLTEIGTLKLWCQSRETEHRWELQFDVRQDPDDEMPEAQDVPDASFDLEKIEAAQAAIRDVFEGDASPGSALWKRLEETLGEARKAWSIPVLRKMADVLLNMPRDRSAAHERTWFDLLGYTLRPGYGDGVDDWRVQEAWKRYLSGLDFPNEIENRLAWWPFWARIGGGLPPEKQAQVYYDARPYIQHQVRTKKRHPLYPRRLDPREKLEAWKTLATFERLPVDIRGALGQIVTEQLQQKPSTSALWALSRLGTRRPVYGPLDRLIPAEEVGGWLKTLLTLRLPNNDSVAYTLVHLTQRTGDRGRDIPSGVRQQVIGRLRRMPESERLLPSVEDADAPLPPEVHTWLLGDPMPAAGGSLLEPQGIVYADVQ